MPIRPPALDDRSFDDLVSDVLARIPAHVPEWSNPRVGDPGRTLVELFAWLVDTLLYRANLIPERQRLQFLRLLGIPLRPASPSRGVVSLALDDDNTDPVTLRALCTVTGPSTFETLGEVTVLPVTAACYLKRRPADAELATLGNVLGALPQVYDLGESKPCYYVTTPVFAGGISVPGGIDLVRESVDASLWIALLAGDVTKVAETRTKIGSAPNGASRLINIGFAPAIEMPELAEDVSKRLEIPHVFEMTTERDVGADSDYLTLERVGDTTSGLTRNGVIRLVLPSAMNIGVPPATDPLRAGVGDRPPRLDDAKLAERLVAWVRLRPTQKLETLKVSWAGINAVSVENRLTQQAKIVGSSNGLADQEVKLPGESVEAETLQIDLQGMDGTVAPWIQVPDLALAGRDDLVYQLDTEAGIVKFGDGVRGRIPPAGQRVRATVMRSGGGAAGNLPPFTLKAMGSRLDPNNNVVARTITVSHGLPMLGGQDSETLADAERRIPAWLRHRDRAVTAADFRSVAADTPGVSLGRVEVIPQFKPQQRRSGVPGVVSTVVWPQKPGWQPPNPRADRPTIEAVHAWLDARRPLSTELYVIGCEYVPVAVSAGIVLREGAQRDEVLAGVRDAIRRFLWPLVPGGVDGTGWPLGRTVKQREIEVVVAQVGGVSEVTGVQLFHQAGGVWQLVPSTSGPPAVTLEAWQLPELLAVTASVGDPPDDPSRLPHPYIGSCVAIPVVPEVC